MDTHSRHIDCGVFCLTRDFNDMKLQYFKAIIAYTNLVQWSAIVTDLDCVKEIFNVNYWRALDRVREIEDIQDKDMLYMFLIITFSAILIGILILFIVYLKRHGCESKDEGQHNTFIE